MHRAAHGAYGQLRTRTCWASVQPHARHHLHHDSMMQICTKQQTCRAGSVSGSQRTKTMSNACEQSSDKRSNSVVSLDGHLEPDVWMSQASADEVLVLLGDPKPEEGGSGANELKAVHSRCIKLLHELPKHVRSFTIWLSNDANASSAFGMAETQELMAAILASPAQLQHVDITGAALHAQALNSILTPGDTTSLGCITSLALAIDTSTLSQHGDDNWTPGVPEQVTQLQLHFMQVNEDVEMDLAFSPDRIYDAPQLQVLSLTAAASPTSARYTRPPRLPTRGLAKLTSLTSLTLDGFLPPHGTPADHPDPSKDPWDDLPDDPDLVPASRRRVVPGPGPQELLPWVTLCKLTQLQRLVLPSLTIVAAYGQPLQHLQHISVGCLVVDVTAAAAGTHAAAEQQQKQKQKQKQQQASDADGASADRCSSAAAAKAGLLVRLMPSLQELQVLQEGSPLHWLASTALRGHPHLSHLRAPIAATWRCFSPGQDALRALPNLHSVHAAVQDPRGHSRPKDVLLALVMAQAARCAQLQELTAETAALLGVQGATALNHARPDNELALRLLCRSCGSAGGGARACSRQERIVQHTRCGSGCSPAVASLLCGSAGRPRKLRRLCLQGVHMTADVEELAAGLEELWPQEGGSRGQQRRRQQRMEDGQWQQRSAAQLQHLAQLVLDGTALVQELLAQAQAGGAQQAAAGADAGSAVGSQLGAGAAIMQVRNSLKAADARLKEVLGSGQWAGLEGGEELRALVEQVVEAVGRRQKQVQLLYRLLLRRDEPLVAELPGGCELRLGVLE